ncbi:hypothetical protein COY62_00940 [bacterium (Candidatus Howlettbacteria) CG_4_10_14_0_8_um_filter_40_9]|nr:MAG: hypothetical protein COY62_00940 [bacterium (Candidatus Howlettbacteria) CG_4_10_14_0_8_um_filter_40_9]
MGSENIYNKKNNIFQSPVWAEFQRAVGRELVEIEGAYFYKEHLIKNKYFLYCPKGTVGEIANSKSQIANKIQNLNVQNVVFVRVEPEPDSRRSLSPLSGGGNDKRGEEFLPVTQNSILSQQYSPKQTLALDLTKSEEELLSNMKPKHRYNIRLAEKKGIKIRQGYSKKDVDDFYNLSLVTSKRDSSYTPHPKIYYEKMAETLGGSGNLQIFTAEYEGRALGSIIILFYNDTAIYLHGASSNEKRELMPNHLAQWEAIKEAKNRGCKFYDFWGIAVASSNVDSITGEDGDPALPHYRATGYVVDETHGWAGITKFKLGFVKLGVTGEVAEFPGAFDLPLNKFWYNGISLLNKARKIVK